MARREPLPEHWTQHTAPTGHIYYHNSETKESTYERPTRKSRNRSVKESVKLPEKPKSCFPVYKIDIPSSDWVLVITNAGTHFYHNRVKNESHWIVDDESLKSHMAHLDKDTLVLLVAKARGFRLDDEMESRLQGLLNPNSEIEIVDIEAGLKPSVSQIETDAEIALQTRSNLVGGYSSSEESDDENEINNNNDDNNRNPEEHPHEVTTLDTCLSAAEGSPEDMSSQSPQESSEEENGLDLADLEDSSDDEEQSDNDVDSTADFISLLDEGDIDPYKPWETESPKIINDARFHVIVDNRTRKLIYDQWATHKIHTRRPTTQAYPDEEPFVKYIRLLETLQLDRFFTDFKKKNADNLASLSLGDREKEKTYKEYVILMKRSDADREKIFRSFITTSKIFRKNLFESKSSGLIQALDLSKVSTMTNDEAYALLHSIEENIKISESLKFNTKYYLVNVKTRIALLKDIVTTMQRN